VARSVFGEHKQVDPPPAIHYLMERRVAKWLPGQVETGHWPISGTGLSPSLQLSLQRATRVASRTAASCLAGGAAAVRLLRRPEGVRHHVFQGLRGSGDPSAATGVKQIPPL